MKRSAAAHTPDKEIGDLDVTAWRSRAMTIILIVLAVTGLPAYASVFINTVRDGKIASAEWIYMAVYAAMLLLACLPCLDYRIRAWGLMAISYINIAASFMRLGLVGSGRLGLIVMPVIATVVLGARSGYTMGALSLAVYGGFAALASLGYLGGLIILKENPLSAGYLVEGGSALLVLLTMVLVLVERFVSLQEKTLDESRNANRKLSETAHALYESESRLRSIGDNLPGGMIYQLEARPDGVKRFTYVSAGVESLHGYDRESVIKDASLMYNQVVEEDAERMLKAEAVALKELKSFDIEVGFRTDKGTPRWSRIVSQPRMSEEGTILADGIELDITAQKIAETQLNQKNQELEAANEEIQATMEELEATNEELQAAMEELESTNEALLQSGNELFEANLCLEKGEANYRAIIENLQDMFYRTDTAGTLTMLSPSFAKVMGYDTLDECIGKNAADFYDNPAERQAFVAELDKNGYINNYEIKLRRRDGGLIIVIANSHYYYDRSGKVAGIEGILHDISERNKIESALRESEERFSKAFRSSPGPMVISEIDTGRFIDVNDKWLEMLGHSREETIGRTSYEQGIWDDPEVRDRLGKQLRRNGYFRNEPVLFITKSGERRHVLWSAEKIVMGGKDVMLSLLYDFTEMREAELQREAALEALRQANLVVENSPVVLFRWKAAEGWPVELVSNNITRFGYTAEELMSGAVPFSSIVHPEDLARVAGEVRAFSDSGIQNFQQEYRLVARDGSIRWIDDRTVIERDAHGRITHYQGIVIDITGRKLAEAALRDSEERFRSLVETTSDFIWETDVRGVYTYISPQVRELLGYEPEELLGKTPFDIMPPHEASSVKAVFNDLAASRTPIIRLLNSVLHKDGRLVRLETSGVPYYGPEGNMVGYRGIDRDITERELADDRLKESEARFRNIANHAPIMIGVTDAAGNITFLNNTWLEFRGKTFEEEAGWAWGEGLHPDDKSRVIASMESAIANNERYSIEYRILDRHGEYRWVLDTAVPLKEIDGSRQGYIGTALDITKRKRAEEALAESESRYRMLSAYNERLNEYAIRLAEAASLDEQFCIIADSYRQLMGAIGVATSRYEPEKGVIRVAAVSAEKDAVENANEILGSAVMDIEIPVPGELVPEIIEQSVLISDSIETLSFGRISRESSETLMKSMGCRMAAAIALHNGTDLLGMAAAYLPGVSTGVPLEALKTFAYMAGLALTRKKTEEEITRLNRDLEKKVEQRTGELRVAYDDIVNTNRELEKAMRELRETQHQLVQAEKLTALGQLAAGIAHELNTPLGSIMSSNRSMIVMMQQKLMETVRFMAGLNDKELAAFDTLVKEAIEHASRIGNPPGRKIKREIAEILAAAGIKRPDELVELIIDSGVFGLREKLVSAVRVRRRKEILEAVQAVASARRLGEVIAIATEKAVHVVNALQNYLRQDMDEEFTGVDVRSEMETILMLYHNKIKQGVTVVKRFDTGDRVLGNRDKLNQLWMNLLNNALQAIDYRGTVEIAAERREEWIVVSVIDSGPGVPEDIRDRIFEPFFTTKGHGEGMGLGLDISRKIAEKHGGRIELETEPGRTKFSVWLKAVDTSV